MRIGKKKFENYLTNLIEEKGQDLDNLIHFTLEDEIEINGPMPIGMSWKVLVENLVETDNSIRFSVYNRLTYLDYKYADIFNYLKFLAIGLVKFQNKSIFQ